MYIYTNDRDSWKIQDLCMFVHAYVCMCTCIYIYIYIYIYIRKAVDWVRFGTLAVTALGLIVHFFHHLMLLKSVFCDHDHDM